MSICVLMSTYNGQKYIRQQIESIIGQTEDDLLLYIRDDVSTDGTVAILKECSNYSNIQVVFGEKNLGAAQSFLWLIEHSPKADYYAFSDQDDIWDKDKLKIAVNLISKEEIHCPGQPIMYHSRVKVTDANGNVICKNGRYSPRGFLKGEKGGIIGCTVVFNRLLKEKLVKYHPRVIAMHDSWVFDVCLSLDGRIIYDETPHICYRQHESNQVGGEIGLLNSIKRRLKFYKRRPKCLNKIILSELLEGYQNEMKTEYVLRARKLIDYDRSIKNTICVLKDREYFRGRKWWTIEQVILILCRRY